MNLFYQLTGYSKNDKKYILPFLLVTTLFFLWAFLHNTNPILIPHLKKACQLSDTQSALIDSSVYIAYFIVALPAGIFLRKFGYKNGILFGLFLYALGAVLFIPASSSRSYIFFLTALFIIASGATFLETVANPYMTLLGDHKSGAQRLNFAQSFNGVGAFLAPILGGKFILSGIEHSKDELSKMPEIQIQQYLQHEADTVKIPYLIITIAVCVVAVLIYFNHVPELKTEMEEEKHEPLFSFHVFKYSQLKWAVIAQFFYVGAQVGVGSFFIRFSKYVSNMPEKEAAFLWGSIAMVGFMVGRFTGTFLMKYIRANVLLIIYAIINILLLMLSIFMHNNIAVYALMAVPFFMSIMFPTIFALGLDEMGEDAKLGSSFIIMSIVGGAVIPLLMGYISDKTGSIQLAYSIPVICFIVVAYFGWKGFKPSAV